MGEIPYFRGGGKQGGRPTKQRAGCPSRTARGPSPEVQKTRFIATTFAVWFLARTVLSASLNLARCVLCVLLLLTPSSMWSNLPPKSMNYYCYMLLGGQKAYFGVHPDSVVTEDYSLPDGTAVHVIVGEEEQEKLLSLQGILDEEE